MNKLSGDVTAFRTCVGRAAGRGPISWASNSDELDRAFVEGQTVNPLFAAAGLAEMSQADSRELEIQIFVVSLIPAVVYFLTVTVAWLFINRNAIRGRRVTLRSLLGLIGVLAPGLAFLRLVPLPYWWR